MSQAGVEIISTRSKKIKDWPNTTGGHVVHTTGLTTPNTTNHSSSSTKRSGSGGEKVDGEDKVYL